MVQPREHRVPIMFSESELALLDDFRFDNRIGTRSGAARWLIHGGILLEEHAPMIVKLLDAGLIAMADAVREKPSPELLAAAQALQDLAEGLRPPLSRQRRQRIAFRPPLCGRR